MIQLLELFLSLSAISLVLEILIFEKAIREKLIERLIIFYSEGLRASYSITSSNRIDLKGSFIKLLRKAISEKRISEKWLTTFRYNQVEQRSNSYIETIKKGSVEELTEFLYSFSTSIKENPFPDWMRTEKMRDFVIQFSSLSSDFEYSQIEASLQEILRAQAQSEAQSKSKIDEIENYLDALKGCFSYYKKASKTEFGTFIDSVFTPSLEVLDEVRLKFLKAHTFSEELNFFIEHVLSRMINSLVSMEEIGSMRNGTSIYPTCDRDIIIYQWLGTEIKHQLSLEDIDVESTYERWIKALNSTSPSASNYEMKVDFPSLVVSHKSNPSRHIDITLAIRYLDTKNAVVYDDSLAKKHMYAKHLKNDPFAKLQEVSRNDHRLKTVFCISPSKGLWTPITPTLHRMIMKRYNDITEGIAAKLIRYLKVWKYQYNVPIRSYYIEIFVLRWLFNTHQMCVENIEKLSDLAGHVVDRNKAYTGIWGLDIVAVLSALKEHLTQRELFRNYYGFKHIDPMPWLADLGYGYSGLVFPCYSSADLLCIVDNLDKSLPIAYEAINEEIKENRMKSIRLWREFWFPN